jgi:hypothetical protein
MHTPCSTRPVCCSRGHDIAHATIQVDPTITKAAPSSIGNGSRAALSRFGDLWRRTLGLAQAQAGGDARTGAEPRLTVTEEPGDDRGQGRRHEGVAEVDTSARPPATKRKMAAINTSGIADSAPGPHPPEREQAERHRHHGVGALAEFGRGRRRRGVPEPDRRERGSLNTSRASAPSAHAPDACAREQHHAGRERDRERNVRPGREAVESTAVLRRAQVCVPGYGARRSSGRSRDGPTGRAARSAAPSLPMKWARWSCQVVVVLDDTFRHTGGALESARLRRLARRDAGAVQVCGG